MDKDNKKDKDYFANFWFYEIGVNVIPADSPKKKPLVKWKEDSHGNWQEIPIPEEIFEKWKSDGLFEKGLAVICGKVYRGENKGKWLNGIDSDNKLGTEKICPGGVKQVASITLLEQHNNKEKAHTYFYTDRPIKSKSGNDGKEGTVPQIEVKSGGKFLLYCAGGNHKDGSAIEIVGTKQVKTMDAQALEERIEGICKEYEIPYLVNGEVTPGKSIQEISKKDFVVHEGENRSIAILRYLDSKKSYNPEFDEEMLCAIGNQFNLDHCKPPYPESKVRAIAKQSYNFIEKNNEVFGKKDEFDFNEDNAISKTIRIITKEIIENKIIDKSELRKKINIISKKFKLDWGSMTVKGILTVVFSDKITFEKIKQIAYEHGINHNLIVLDKGQTTETAYWIMGRYHIKRVELTGNLLLFNGKYYDKEAEEMIRRAARDCLIESTKKDMSEIVSLIEDKSDIIKCKDVERDINLICVPNGIFNAKTGEFTTEFSPDNIILDQIPHNYDEKATWEEIDKKVTEIIPDDHSRQSYYDFISLCFLQFTGIDKQLGGVGVPGTGKSALCDLMEMTLGSENVKNASIHAIASDPTTQIDVAFKRLNIDQELSSEDIKSVDVMKKWITQDPFTARSIYKHNTTFRPIARLCFMANELFEIPNNDNSEAIYERTHLIKMCVKFRGTKKDIKNVFEKIASSSELDGFLTYLLKNAAEIYKNQQIHFPIDTSIVASIWNQHGNRIRNFIDKWLVKNIDFKTHTFEVWSKWLTVALAEKFPAKTKNKFFEDFDQIIGMTSNRIYFNRDDRSWGYRGFRIRTDEEVAKWEQERIDKDRT